MPFRVGGFGTVASPNLPPRQGISLLRHAQAPGIIGGSRLSLCKIHHAAYDRRLLGIRPDYEVRINQRLLDEVDGPMLRHGLQEMHGRPLTVPRQRSDQPDRERLGRRFDLFLGA